MANFIEKYILNVAKSIEAKELAKAKLTKEAQEKEAQERIEKYEKKKQAINLLVNEIRDWYEQEISKFNIDGYYLHKTDRRLDIKVGDTVIANRYALRKDSKNFWDGGANILISEGGNVYYENPKPLLYKVTDIYVDSSYVEELIDKFLNAFSDDYLIESGKDKIVDFYKFWLKNYRNNSRFDEKKNLTTFNGLYVGVKIQSDEFQPKWGLNIFSFLNVESTHGLQTKNIWTKQYENNEKISKLKQEIKEIEKENSLLI